MVLLKGGIANDADIFFGLIAVTLWPSLFLMRLADSFGVAAAGFLGLIVLNIVWWGMLAFLVWPLFRTKDFDGNAN